MAGRKRKADTGLDVLADLDAQRRAASRRWALARLTLGSDSPEAAEAARAFYEARDRWRSAN